MFENSVEEILFENSIAKRQPAEKMVLENVAAQSPKIAIGFQEKSSDFDFEGNFLKYDVVENEDVAPSEVVVLSGYVPISDFDHVLAITLLSLDAVESQFEYLAVADLHHSSKNLLFSQYARNCFDLLEMISQRSFDPFPTCLSH